MFRPAIALITGFARNRDLVSASMKPILSLRNSGIIRDIIYVVSDDPAYDRYASYVSEYDGIRTIRTPRINADGLSIRHVSLFSQIRDLKTGLDLIGDDDALVLKTRPDYVIEASFLASKIINFDRICAPTNLYDLYPVGMPEPIFKNKVWIPWADANLFFFYDDTLCLGLKQDVMHFTQLGDQKFLHLLNEENFHIYENFFHTFRASAPFLDRFPIFRCYMNKATLFHREVPYRYKMIEISSQLFFFWILLVAHTWILATHFHIDIGRNKQMQIFSTRVNEGADWSDFASLKSSAPFTNFVQWRERAVPGGFFPFLGGAYSRIMDDRWLSSIFTKTDLRDITEKSVTSALEMAANYEDGSLAAAEGEYYDKLSQFQKAFDAGEYNSESGD